ncbi:MAG: RNA methyltransferase [Desulfobulbaceae bacterium]|nr:RNA methyltransferase [Desulfobulbaceae bacterium]
MTFPGATSLNIALIHHPVVNKKAEVIGSAVTNLDLHDIARMARTYGVENYFITTPYRDQHILVKELLEHWKVGYGAKYNPARKEALSLVRLCGSIDAVIETLTERYGKRPLLVTTSAHKQNNMILYGKLREIIDKKDPVLLLFGTAHGLSPEVMQSADGTLPPITGKTDYNHLSVRSAASIIIDRLLGSREE